MPMWKRSPYRLKLRLRTAFAPLAVVGVLACRHDRQSQVPTEPSTETTSTQPSLGGARNACDVIIAGGSLASLAAGLHSAREGAYTCLVEPTQAVGGQMTVQGVTPPDFAGHQVDALNVGFMARHRVNIASEVFGWLATLGNPGRCWVSSWCFETTPVEDLMERAVAAEPRLRVIRQAVVTGVRTDTTGAFPYKRRITAVEVVQRVGNDRQFFLSDVLADWYDPVPSARYPTKRWMLLTGRDKRPPVVLDASAFGDVLVLSGSRWLQGADAADGGTFTAADTCGLAIVFPFALEYHADSVPADEWASLGVPSATDPRFSLGTFGWDRVWSYRRLAASASGPRPGDLSMQNWNPGNDYRTAYYLASMADTRAEAQSGWRGGLRLDVLRAAERQALDYAAWYRMQAPDSIRPFLALSMTWGNASGLAAMPYVRDARRSIGIDDYVLEGKNFLGPGSQITGTVFPDRIAIGAYQFDFRTIRGCRYPAYVSTTPWTLPYYVPFRALTNGDVSNLLVAGKTMAQSTLANTATRLHPTEWNTGLAAGVAAAWMATNRANSRAAYGRVAEIQSRIARYVPIDWTYVAP